MKPEAQRVAIAKALGLSFSKVCLGWDVQMARQTRETVPISDDGPDVVWVKNGQIVHYGPTDYLDSLDAMHEAEKVLTMDQIGEYENQLYKLTNEPLAKMPSQNAILWCGHRFFLVAHASAPQRAEALLRTLGLWEEVSGA